MNQHMRYARGYGQLTQNQVFRIEGAEGTVVDFPPLITQISVTIRDMFGTYGETPEDYIAEGRIFPMPNIDTRTLQLLAGMLQTYGNLFIPGIPLDQNAINKAVTTLWGTLPVVELEKIMLAINYLDIPPLLAGVTHLFAERMPAGISSKDLAHMYNYVAQEYRLPEDKKLTKNVMERLFQGQDIFQDPELANEIKKIRDLPLAYREV